MAFCDQTILKLTAGNGGNGCVAFRREKFIAKGGPNGGDGGKGGDIIFKVKTALNTLTHLDTYKQFTAEKGEMGKGQNQHGANADDLILEVPLGTIIREVKRDETGEIISKELIADLSSPQKSVLVAKGGKGGFGNAHFVSSIRQAPKFAEIGEDGEQIEVELELKLVADVGIIGIPSAGKSTLISVLSNAKPKIAEYHFTTLKPHLGVAQISPQETYVIADIPGLIEHAHQGKGLGIQFLKHVQRCRILVHLIDPYQPSLSAEGLSNFQLINRELEAFSPDLAEKKQIVVINKADLMSEEQEHELRQQLTEEMEGSDRFTLYPESISAATTKGIESLKFALYKELQLLKPTEQEEEERTSDDEEQDEENPTPKHTLYRPHLENPKYFSVEKLDDNFYQVNGQRISQIVNMTDFTNREGIMRVYDVIRRMGIEKELKKIGIQNGDHVRIGKHEIEYHPEDEY